MLFKVPKRIDRITSMWEDRMMRSMSSPSRKRALHRDETVSKCMYFTLANSFSLPDLSLAMFSKLSP